MQRCPYVYEMKERFLSSQQRGDSFAMESLEREKLLGDHSASRPGSNQVGKSVPTVATVVKVRMGSISLETPQKIQVIFIFIFLSFVFSKCSYPPTLQILWPSVYNQLLTNNINF